MTKFKKILKNKILIFILGGILCGTITVYATTYFPSNQVTYDNTVSKLNSTDVQGAIDELYNTCSDSITSGNYIYFVKNTYTSNYNEPYGGDIYKTTLDGNSSTRLIGSSTGTRIDSIYVTKDHIYFSINKYKSNSTGIKIPTSGSIYRVNLTGQNSTQLISVSNNSGIGNIYVTEDYIYYVVNIYNNYNWNKNGQIYRADLTGQNSTRIISDSGSIEGMIIK